MKKWIIPTIFAVAVVTGIYSWQAIAKTTQAPVVEATKKPQPLSKYEVGKPTAKEMLELVNKERAKVGVKSLKLQPNLMKSAQYKANDFVRNNYYSHVSPVTGKHGYELVFMVAGSLCKFASENIGADLHTSYQYVNGWMHSAPHKKAILDARYTYTGFGVSKEADGDYYAVEHFCIAK